MIGTSREMLFYAALFPAWYKPLGLAEKQGWKLKRRVLAGRFTEGLACKTLAKLGYRKVRDSITLSALYLTPHGDIVTESVVVINCATRRNGNRRLSQRAIDKMAARLGYTPLSCRQTLPSVWEKPSSIADRAYTKRDVLSVLLSDSSELLDSIMP